MKTAIYGFTYGVTIKDNPCYSVCQESKMKYAWKVGADLIMRTDFFEKPVIEYEHFNYKLMPDKYHIHKLLDYYDRVLYLDGDVFIKDNAPNIFIVNENDEFLYMSNEVKANGVEYDDAIEKIKCDEWTKTDGHYDFYNAGVILVSKAQRELFNFKKEEYCRFEGYPLICDQPYLNWKIFKYGIPIRDLDRQFNAMAYFKNDGFFIHFANVHNRNELINEYNNI